MRILFLITFLPFILSANEKLALIIANQNYQYINSLTNPIQEITNIEEKLTELGFKVYKYHNLNSEKMLHAINEFNIELSKKKEPIAFFYYSGHGSQVEHEAYLIPINVNTTNKENIRFRGIRVEEVLNRISANKNYANILFIDACRDVPLGNKGGEKGLGQVNNIKDKSLILFSTKPGEVAKDNSLFNKIVLENLSKIEPFIMVVNNISQQVAEKTNKTQIPTYRNVIFPNFILNENSTEDIFKIDNLVYQNQFFSKKFYWKEANTYCKELAINEYNNWRLPTQDELKKLSNIKLFNWNNEKEWNKWIQENIDKKNKEYFITDAFISNMPEKDWFWVSKKNSQFVAYGMSFSRGIINAPIPRTNKAYVLCVQEIQKAEKESWWKSIWK